MAIVTMMGMGMSMGMGEGMGMGLRMGIRTHMDMGMSIGIIVSVDTRLYAKLKTTGARVCSSQPCRADQACGHRACRSCFTLVATAPWWASQWLQSATSRAKARLQH